MSAIGGDRDDNDNKDGELSTFGRLFLKINESWGGGGGGLGGQSCLVRFPDTLGNFSR